MVKLKRLSFNSNIKGRESDLIFYTLFLVFALGAAGCFQHSNNLTQSLEEIRGQIAPDKRVAIFEYRVEDEGILIKTSEEEAINLVENYPDLKQLNVRWEMLPSESLGEKNRALINLSVGNIRVEPGHSKEMATQALLGSAVRVLEKTENGWYRIQTPDRYIGYADPAVIHRVTERELNDWIESDRVIFMDEYGFMFEKPSSNSDYISDLAAGNILKRIGRNGSFYQVEMPDGRKGYVSLSQVQPFADWKRNVVPTQNNLATQAKRMLGVPYLWGGTSTKGVDCSGFTKTIYLMNGIQLPRDASQQVFAGDDVPADTSDWSALEVGDLLFFGSKATQEKKERVTHVAMYLGDGKIIHSSGRVKIESLRRGDPTFNEYRYKTYLRSKRILTALDSDGVELIKTLSLY